MGTTYTWTAIVEMNTLMKLRNKDNPMDFSKLFVPFMVSMMHKANTKDLKNIKIIIESK
jgi:hypothetical protein